MKIGTDFKKTITKEYLGNIALSHLECWRERYANYGGNKRRLEVDLYHNHDTILEIERVEEDLGRKLTTDEETKLINLFNGEVIRLWRKGDYVLFNSQYGN